MNLQQQVRDPNKQRIRELNDAFRASFQGGQVVLTASVDALASDVKAMAIRKVATFADFDEGNDPHGEHDFGSFKLAGHSFFWKIDLYEEPGVKDGNGEPVVKRVLTIMLAEDW